MEPVEGACVPRRNLGVGARAALLLDPEGTAEHQCRECLARVVDQLQVRADVRIADEAAELHTGGRRDEAVGYRRNRVAARVARPGLPLAELAARRQRKEAV